MASRGLFCIEGWLANSNQCLGFVLSVSRRRRKESKQFEEEEEGGPTPNTWTLPIPAKLKSPSAIMTTQLKKKTEISLKTRVYKPDLVTFAIWQQIC